MSYLSETLLEFVKRLLLLLRCDGLDVFLKSRRDGECVIKRSLSEGAVYRRVRCIFVEQHQNYLPLARYFL